MFFGRRYRVDRRTGVIFRDWKEKTKQKHECMPYSAGGLDSARQEEADFEEAMTIYDYPVSYTHLDVYKRQGYTLRSMYCPVCPV